MSILIDIRILTSAGQDSQPKTHNNKAEREASQHPRLVAALRLRFITTSKLQVEQQTSSKSKSRLQTNKHIRGLRQAKKDGKGGFAANDDDNDEISLDYVLGDIIGTTLANKMGKNDPEYKNFKESFDQVTTYFIERYTYIQDELVHDIFTELNKRAEDIVGVVSKNMMDFCDLAEFFTSALHKTNPQVTSAGSADADAAEEENIFKLIVDTFSKLGIQILNEDPQ